MQEGRVKRGPVEVPKIGAPFPVVPGAHAGEAQRRHMGWADRHSVFCSEEERRRFAAMDMGALAALLYPEASSPEDAQLVADWCAWLLLRDDRWDSTENPEEWERLAARDRSYLGLMRRVLGRTVGVVHAEGEGDGLYRALADLCERLRGRARREGLPDPVDRRLVAVMKSFFFASVRETAYQRRGAGPTLPEYVRMRSVTGGLDILTFVLAALDGIRLPRVLLEEPTVRHLTAASHNVCCWHNDLVSLNKELAAGEVHNLVLVLLGDPEDGCGSLEGAVETAVRMIRREIDSFACLEREVRAMGEPWRRAASWYAGMLRDRVGGVIVWHEACAVRYRQALSSPEPNRRSRAAEAEPSIGPIK